MGNRDKGYFIFQGSSLLVPAGTPDSLIQKAADAGIAKELLSRYSEDEADEFIIPPPDVHLPGGSDNGNWISAAMLRSSGEPAGWKQIPMRQAMGIVNAGAMAEGTGDTGRLMRAFHIAQWRKDSLFCGTCGCRNADDETELARKCPSCGRLEFPRIAPAVITIIVNDRDEALLAHNRKFATKIYALIAGFNEAGENLETTVAREIREEVSIEVRDIRYICSQPWPFPNSLMLGFCARHAGGSIKTDGVEIEDAGWFSRDNLPLLPLPGSVSRYLIDLWLSRKL